MHSHAKRGNEKRTPISATSASLWLSFLLLLISQPLTTQATTAENFKTHCASCHGENRLGMMGPALLPENLGRLKKTDAFTTIKEGRAQTQMPAFGDKLSDDEINDLVNLAYTPVVPAPNWTTEDIRSSQIIYEDALNLPNKPLWKGDPMNLFTVVELGDHHATLLNGDNFKPIHRFQTRFALHGGPKYSPTGRYVYFGSRDGWVSKYDLYNLKFVAEIRAGINMRNVAVSNDGRYVIAANYLPHTLVLFSGEDLSLIKVIPVESAGKTSRVSAVYDAAPRNSFIAAFKDIPEVWEINYQDQPPMGFGKWIHDFNQESGDGDIGAKFPIRKMESQDFIDDFFFTQDYIQLIGASREGKGLVLDLDVGKVINTLDLPGMPHLGSGITWPWHDTTILATPNLKEGSVTFIDMKTWKTIKKIDTLGPGFFMRSHENSKYAWVDNFFGKQNDTIQLIDKEKLEIVKTLTPAPGKVAAHVEFDKTGKHALLSLWDMDGAVIVYDANTLKEIKRLPMKKPSGKYNVYNKLTRSAGTSH
ncbi:MAG: c-type cytochrome [Gammaproteobacteria bacterium]|nr:c-type cytochrome [Gammaproteobacteria bacterium]